MTTETANDFLTKQLFIEKKIVSGKSRLAYSQPLTLPFNKVTYRSLSRQLGIHVNAAKK
jgi:hypothetical protein